MKVLKQMKKINQHFFHLKLKIIFSGIFREDKRNILNC